MEISYITMMEDISAGNETIEDDDDDYEYFDVTQRANRILGKPTRIIALILRTLAVTGNVLSLVVICKFYRTMETQSSHLAFVISLAASDVLFCLSVMFHIINKVVNPVYYPAHGPYHKRLQSRCAYFIMKCLNTTAINMTLLNLTGMAVDHYVAILKPFHYQRILSNQRYIVVIIAFWTGALLCGFSDFLSVFPDWDQWELYEDKFNLCEFVFLSPYQEEYTVYPLAAICLGTMVFSYVR